MRSPERAAAGILAGGWVVAALLEVVGRHVDGAPVAELEADGRYVESRHDPFFAGFGEDALTPTDLALFPDYFVSIPPDRNDAPENARQSGCRGPARCECRAQPDGGSAHV